MNPGDCRSRARLERILRELKTADLDQWQIADRIVIARHNGIRNYIRLLVERGQIHIIKWTRYSQHDGPYIPVLRYGPGVNVPKPKAKTRADRYATLKADKMAYDISIAKSTARNRKPPKPDDMLAWVFKPKGEVNGNQ